MYSSSARAMSASVPCTKFGETHTCILVPLAKFRLQPVGDPRPAIKHPAPRQRHGGAVQRITAVESERGFVGFDGGWRVQLLRTVEQFAELVHVARDEGQVEGDGLVALVAVGRYGFAEVRDLPLQLSPQLHARLAQRGAGVRGRVIKEHVNQRFGADAGNRMDSEEEQQLRIAQRQLAIQVPDLRAPEAAHAKRCGAQLSEQG